AGMVAHALRGLVYLAAPNDVAPGHERRDLDGGHLHGHAEALRQLRRAVLPASLEDATHRGCHADVATGHAPAEARVMASAPRAMVVRQPLRRREATLAEPREHLADGEQLDACRRGDRVGGRLALQQKPVDTF